MKKYKTKSYSYFEVLQRNASQVGEWKIIGGHFVQDNKYDYINLFYSKISIFIMYDYVILKGENNFPYLFVK